MKLKKSRKENPQKLTQLSSRSHPRHFVGKRTAQKDTIIDITSDSQVNSNFPSRWSPASQITKEPKQDALGRLAIKITGGGGGLELVCGRPTLALASALVHQIQQLRTRKKTKKTIEKQSGQLVLKDRWPQCQNYIQDKYTQ